MKIQVDLESSHEELGIIISWKKKIEGLNKEEHTKHTRCEQHLVCFYIVSVAGEIGLQCHLAAIRSRRGRGNDE
ncbi:hypothetical protein COE51_04780 [Bacillus pseudomycoides]|nr:hypothetical protein COE51_04780 [Bacillus pseudomycoides]